LFFYRINIPQEFKLKMQSLKLRREKLNIKEHELRESLANFEKYINVRNNLYFRKKIENNFYLGIGFQTNAST
jgi:glutaredoxin-related protein